MRHADYLIGFATTGSAPTLAEFKAGFPKMEWRFNDVTEIADARRRAEAAATEEQGRSQT